jgi:hypothetical protein
MFAALGAKVTGMIIRNTQQIKSCIQKMLHIIVGTLKNITVGWIFALFCLFISVNILTYP